jgi:hypothetical protein
MEVKKIYVKNRLTIKSKTNSWIYKYTYNPHLVNFHQENSDYNGNLTFEKQFDDISITYYNNFIKNMVSLTNELNNVNKNTFWGTKEDAQYVDFTYYDDKLVYQFVTENSCPKNWYKFIKLKYNDLNFSLEYIVEDEIYNKNENEKFCLCLSQNKESTIYQNIHINNKSYKKVD